MSFTRSKRPLSSWSSRGVGSNCSLGSEVESCSRSLRCSREIFFGVNHRHRHQRSPLPRPDTSGSRGREANVARLRRFGNRVRFSAVERGMVISPPRASVGKSAGFRSTGWFIALEEGMSCTWTPRRVPVRTAPVAFTSPGGESWQWRCPAVSDGRFFSFCARGAAAGRTRVRGNRSVPRHCRMCARRAEPVVAESFAPRH